MRFEYELPYLAIGGAVASLGLILLFLSSSNRVAVWGSLLVSLALGPAVLPGHGEWIVVQAGALLFEPHQVARAVSLVFILVWWASVSALRASWRRRAAPSSG